MSLQNLLKKNDYDLYCDTINVNNFGIDTIETNSILPIGTGTSINIFDPNASPCTLTVNGNITLPPSLNNLRRIGSSGAGYSELWCKQLQGLGAPVQVQNGIEGNNGTQPLYVANNGLKFTNTVPAAPVTNYAIDKYIEYNGTLPLNGYTTSISAAYSAVVCGNQVTMSLVASSGQIILGGSYVYTDTIPSPLIPLHDQYFTYLGQSPASNNFQGLGWIDTVGTIHFSSDLNYTIFAPNANVGINSTLPIPSGTRLVIHYLLN